MSDGVAALHRLERTLRAIRAHLHMARRCIGADHTHTLTQEMERAHSLVRRALEELDHAQVEQEIERAHSLARRALEELDHAQVDTVASQHTA